MANEQGRRQGERQSSAMERSERGERGMARQYQDPFSLFDSLFERMQRDFFGTSLLNAFLPTRGGEGGDWGQFVRVPRVQMRESGDALELIAEMPGIDSDNVSVQVEGDVLTIRGEQRSEEQQEEARTERRISFYRQIALPEGVDSEQAQASYKNGILTLRFPQTRAQNRARQIPISTEQQQGQSEQQSQQKGRAA